jgi:hypothetical protein
MANPIPDPSTPGQTRPPTFVRGWLDRIDKSGNPEHIDMTEDDVHSAADHYTRADMLNITIEMSNGDIIRPYRFCTPVANGDVKSWIDEDGDSICSI